MDETRVTGLGGIFFRSRDRESTLAWYRDRLGIDCQDWGGFAFRWREQNRPEDVIEQHPNGKFAWILDPEGRKIGLWEPVPSLEDPYL